MNAQEPKAEQKICPGCGKVTALTTNFCMGCGREFQTKFPPPVERTQFVSPQPPNNYYATQSKDDIQLRPGTHNPWVSAFFSFFIIGLGQIYNRQIIKGVLLFFVSYGLAALTFPIGLIFLLPPFWLAGLIDACRVGQKLRDGNLVGQWEMF